MRSAGTMPVMLTAWLPPRPTGLISFVVVAIAACGGKAPPPATPANRVAVPTADPPATPTEPADAADREVCATRTDDIGPMQLDATQAAARHGATAKTFADAPSTKERPIEVCGVPGERRWLTNVTCANGKSPYASASAVASSRSGNVGPGGRCGSIIDHYKVTCPEATYDVYMDMYMCREGETLF